MRILTSGIVVLLWFSGALALAADSASPESLPAKDEAELSPARVHPLLKGMVVSLRPTPDDMGLTNVSILIPRKREPSARLETAVLHILATDTLSPPTCSTIAMAPLKPVRNQDGSCLIAFSVAEAMLEASRVELTFLCSTAWSEDIVNVDLGKYVTPPAAPSPATGTGGKI